MNVKLIAHTALSDDFLRDIPSTFVNGEIPTNDRAAVALTAIRTCYSANKPSEIVALEGAKYFGQSASDGESGTEADRLFRHIVRSGHASTLEHLTYTFAIEGVSRSLLAQITRHRQLSFSVQSQRYVKFGSNDKSGGFDYVTPPSIGDTDGNTYRAYTDVMETLQDVYDRLRAAGVTAEDARMVLPNAAATNLVMTGNLRALIELYGKRNERTHSQWEIAALAEYIREEVTKVDAWLAPFFE
ncbi:FAD-dependent thymidylate synthase [Paenibacillus agricola]|uniref:FAD-dependent thymidylate synthase n=1 Tax=Paenibacillus agricola TaxID=2716264 RepID=A0ABX0J4C9_9BACL|nr:FAD-dependent thymidylate synthase [Paenibacillus agricola]NHN31154.1 FAD-dependent thymidylate synthase [Paenibacillus agricola]